MSDVPETPKAADERLLLSIFDDEHRAEALVRRLAKEDFPLDMVSLLGKAQSSGDDPLGIYYQDVTQRIKGWGKMGAFWGGLWGLLTGAAGLFLVPGLGAVLAAGPIVHAIVGAVAGAGLTGGVMAGAAVLSQLSVAMHRMGVPEERLEELHGAIERGEYVVMLRLSAEDAERWQRIIASSGARDTMVFPYRSLLDLG